MYRTHKPQAGFTLVELMLGTAFVGSLLVLVAIIIIQIMGLYNKGLTLKEVNEVSRVVVRDMQQSINGADFFKLQYIDTVSHTPTYAKTLQKASTNTVDYYANDAGGRLCTGSYSYIWNTGAAIRHWRDSANKTSPQARAYKKPSNATGPSSGYKIQFFSNDTPSLNDDIPIRFVKKLDTNKEVCRVPSAETFNPLSDSDDVNSAQYITTQDKYSNTFGTGNNELVLYNLSIETPLKPTSEDRTDDLTAISTFYYVKMTLGTQNGDENTDGDGLIAGDQTCKAPGAATQNEGEYCAVNKIDFVARTGRIGET